jgi:peptidyl-dipeptidase A
MPMTSRHSGRGAASRTRRGWVAAALALAGLAACGRSSHASSEPERAPESVTVVAESPREFLDRFDREMESIVIEQSAAGWVSATYITADTALLAAAVNARQGALVSRLIAESRAFRDLELDPVTRRDFSLLTRSDYMPEHMSVPSDPAKLAEVTALQKRMINLYESGRYCPGGEDNCRTLQQLSDVLAHSRDYDEQLEAWTGWREVTRSMRADYRRLVELTTEGAQELGFADMGQMWRSAFDMSPAAFAEEVERLWGQVAPFYEQLHCYVRDRLADHYGDGRVSRTGPMPAHVLGNMWAQSWENVFDLVVPYRDAPAIDVTAALEAGGYDAQRMTRVAEGFFTSLGLPALPGSFWERSLLTRPRDRDVACHASAWNMNPAENDVRLKQCVTPTGSQLETLHHELGHVYYYLAYNHLGFTHRRGAQSGFHEGIGDTLVLSMTPGYYEQIGLIDGFEHGERALINEQMRLALDKIAFMPFGKLVDQWRWGVFAGAIEPQDYNAAWWALRQKYQGVRPPVDRDETDFDPGAKHHVPGNTPYTRYFLARILQFQFHRALCEAAGDDGPLHECSIYGSEAAGERLWRMMSYGTSQPWQDTLEAAIGARQMDASAIAEYFAPLIGWLQTQNAGRTCGWD